MTVNDASFVPVMQANAPKQPDWDGQACTVTDEEKILEKIRALDMEIGRRIRVLRQKRKMTQRGMGECVGCSFQQVQKYESGQNHISAPRLFLIAEALDCRVEDLIPETQSGAAAENMVDVAGLSPEKQKIIKDMVEALRGKAHK